MHANPSNPSGSGKARTGKDGPANERRVRGGEKRQADLK
jgi:hypothetical protein